MESDAEVSEGWWLIDDKYDSDAFGECESCDPAQSSFGAVLESKSRFGKNKYTLIMDTGD